MVSEDVIQRAREATARLEKWDSRASSDLYSEAVLLLRLLADDAEAEAARRRAVMEATGADEGLLAAIRAKGGRARHWPLARDDASALLRHIDRLEALLSDAEDTLRARAQGRREGLLEAAAMAHEVVLSPATAVLASKLRLAAAAIEGRT